MRSITLLALMIVSSTGFCADAVDSGNDSLIRQKVALYNGVPTTDVLIALWKVSASPADVQYLDRLHAQVKNQKLPKAFYSGQNLIFFTGNSRPMEIVDINKLQFSYKRQVFTIYPTDFRKTLDGIEQAVNKSADISWMNFLLPEANAAMDMSSLTSVALGGLGGLFTGGAAGGLVGAGTSFLGYSMGQQNAQQTCQTQLAQQAYVTQAAYGARAPTSALVAPNYSYPYPANSYYAPYVSRTAVGY
jgi:hypothetical protein